MTGTNDNDEDVPTLLSWSAGDNCSVRALRRVCSTAVCDLTCSTGHQQPVCSLPGSRSKTAGQYEVPGRSRDLGPPAPSLSVFCAAICRCLGHSHPGTRTGVTQRRGVGNYIMVTVMRRADQ